MGPEPVPGRCSPAFLDADFAIDRDGASPELGRMPGAALGLLLVVGLGVAWFAAEQDAGQAVISFREAAEQGLAEAQFNLGFRYAEGDGVPTDPGQAGPFPDLDRDAASSSEAVRYAVADAGLASTGGHCCPHRAHPGGRVAATRCQRVLRPQANTSAHPPSHPETQSTNSSLVPPDVLPLVA